MYIKHKIIAEIKRYLLENMVLLYSLLLRRYILKNTAKIINTKYKKNIFELTAWYNKLLENTKGNKNNEIPPIIPYKDTFFIFIV